MIKDQVGVQQIKMEIAEKLTNIGQKSKDAMEYSSKLVHVKWQVKRAEFVKYYSDTQRVQTRSTASKICAEINEFKEKCDVDAKHEEYIRVLKDLEDETGNLEKKLEDTTAFSLKLEVKLREKCSAVSVLKKRNAALKLKLEKQKKEYSKQIEFSTFQLQQFNDTV